MTHAARDRPLSRLPAVRLLAAGLAVGLLAAGAGCSESEDDRRRAYCDQVAQDADGITRAVDEGGPGAFLEVLPTLEGLSEKSPSDLKDEWQILLDALHGLDEALDATGLDPADLDGADLDGADQGGGGLPRDLPRADRRRVRGAASVLAAPEVVAATRGIEQHALDICKQPLL